MKSLESRMATKTTVLPNGCWRWTGFIDKAGYGRVREGDRSAPVLYCHVANYEKRHGPVPDGLELDHVEPVTHKVNALRGHAPNILLHLAKKCARGHDANEANTYRYKLGKRAGRVAFCKICRRERRVS